MFKRILISLLIMSFMPVYAGQYEDAVNNNEKVFMYLYTKSCGYCRKANPIYQKLEKLYKDKCKFLKLDAETYEGTMVMMSYGASYVPFVLMINTKEQKAELMPVECFIDYSCTERTLQKFLQ